MDKIETPWPPRVGDHIQLVATGARGQVMEVMSSGDSRQFVVGIYSQNLGKVTKAPHRTFRLREIAPGPVAPSVPAAGRSRTKPPRPE
jgi:hypothetical protein